MGFFFGSVTVESPLNQTHQFRVRNKDNLSFAEIINIFNGNLISKAFFLSSV